MNALNNAVVVAPAQQVVRRVVGGDITCTTGTDNVKRYFKNGKQISHAEAIRQLALLGKRTRCVRKTKSKSKKRSSKKRRSSKKGKKRSSKKGKKRSSKKGNKGKRRSSTTVAKTEVFVRHMTNQGARPIGHIKTSLLVTPAGQQFPYNIELLNIDTVDGNMYADIINQGQTQKMAIPFDKIGKTGYGTYITAINASNKHKAIGFVFGVGAGNWNRRTIWVYLTDSAYGRMRSAYEKIGRMAKRNKIPFVLNKV